MRKQDIVNIIADKTGIPKVDILITLETLFEETRDAVVRGKTLYIRGFGSFFPKKRAAKIGRDMIKNVAVNINEHFVPSFKPCKEFHEEVKLKCKEEVS